MSMNRNRRINARTAEDLLNGGGVDGRHARVADVLRAAASPGRPAELAGRHEVVAAFHSARLRPEPSPRRQSMIKTAVVKLLTVKAAAIAALVVAGGGGVALAASTGALPNPLTSHQPAPASSSGQSGSHGPAASPHPRGSADPSPSLVGLCHAYTAGAGSSQGNTLDNPAFTALVTAAGGKANVDSYCTNLLASDAAHPSGAPGDHPTGAPSSHPGAPTSHPTGAPTAHPTDAPTDHPTGAPTDHPTGPPSGQPGH